MLAQGTNRHCPAVARCPLILTRILRHLFPSSGNFEVNDRGMMGGASAPPQDGHGIHRTHGRPSPQPLLLLFPLPDSASRCSSRNSPPSIKRPCGGGRSQTKKGGEGVRGFSGVRGHSISVLTPEGATGSMTVAGVSAAGFDRRGTGRARPRRGSVRSYATYALRSWPTASPH